MFLGSSQSLCVRQKRETVLSLLYISPRFLRWLSIALSVMNIRTFQNFNYQFKTSKAQLKKKENIQHCCHSFEGHEVQVGAFLTQVLKSPFYRSQHYSHFTDDNRTVKVTMCCAQSLSCVRLFAGPWTVAHQAPLSMGVPRQEYWSGLPFPGKNTGVGCLLLLQQIFPTQGLNMGLLNFRQILYCLSPEVMAYSSYTQK